MKFDSHHKITVEVSLDVPVLIENSVSAPVFATRLTFWHNGLYWHGEGFGWSQKKDGSQGRAERNLYALRLSDLPEDIAQGIQARYNAEVTEVFNRQGATA